MRRFQGSGLCWEVSCDINMSTGGLIDVAESNEQFMTTQFTTLARKARFVLQVIVVQGWGTLPHTTYVCPIQESSERDEVKERNT